jgi:hypothetical protein
MKSHSFVRSGGRADHGRMVLAAAGVLALASTMTAAVTPAAAATAAPARALRDMAAAARPVGRMKTACRTARPGFERCFVLYAAQASVNAAIAAGAGGAAAAPKGWGARAIELAYQLPVSRISHQTVAVSVAFNTPHLARYLAVYRNEYGLPACSTQNGCFREVNQAGQPSPLPVSGVPYGWDVETTLDISMISAACPHCKILVVEADSPSLADLAASEDTAARLGAQVISNSYGSTEGGATQVFAQAYRHPGHTIVVAAGDSGFGPVSFPANLASVTAVGGTELARAQDKRGGHENRRGWREKVWNNDAGGAGGSGCSAYVAKPAWQHDPHCSMRTVADVSAVATGVPIYDKRHGGWLTVEGTSISAPLIAGIYGLAGNAAAITPGYPYRHASSLFDISAGDNILRFDGILVGNVCGRDYLCVAKAGYDAPTGLGSPHGIGAF